MRLGLLLSVAALSLAGAAVPERPAIAAAPAARWGTFRDGFIEGWFKVDPANAVYQGRHDFDGGLGDWSPAGLKAQGDFLRASIATAKRFTALTGADAFERDYLIKVAEGKLFWLEDADQPHSNPAWYVNAGLDPNVYVARNYAPAPVRLKALTAFLAKVPAAAANIRANLRTPMPLSYINFGAAAFNGFADYYTGDAKAAFAVVKDPAAQKRFDVAAAAASKAMKDLGAWLESQRGTATQGFALGPERFARMIYTTEGVDTPLAELEKIGQADLKRNQAALAAACGIYAPPAWTR